MTDADIEWRHFQWRERKFVVYFVMTFFSFCVALKKDTPTNLCTSRKLFSLFSFCFKQELFTIFTTGETRRSKPFRRACPSWSHLSDYYSLLLSDKNRCDFETGVEPPERNKQVSFAGYVYLYNFLTSAYAVYRSIYRFFNFLAIGYDNQMRNRV